MSKKKAIPEKLEEQIIAKDIMQEDHHDDDRSNMTMDTLTEQEEFPKPDEEAIAAIQKIREQEAVTPDTEIFDPSIHASGSDGKPSVTKTGKFRKKKGFLRPEAVSEKKKQPDILSITSEAAAKVTSRLIEQLSVTLISDEWAYSELERASNIKAWEECYNYYGGVNLSPPWALACNHVALIVARAHKEKTQTKLAMAVVWLKSKFKRKPKNGSHSNLGNDGKRQDNLGAEKSTLASKN